MLGQILIVILVAVAAELIFGKSSRGRSASSSGDSLGAADYDDDASDDGEMAAIEMLAKNPYKLSLAPAIFV